jgi:predicted nucleic acid-binding Zn ribbon protein
MPIYLYVCEKENCKDASEEFFSISNYPQEISCFKDGCEGKKKLTPSIGFKGRVDFKIAGDNSGSQPKRMKK